MTSTTRTTNGRITGQTAADRFGILEMPDLSYTPEVAAETEHLYQRVAHHVPASNGRSTRLMWQRSTG